jgi:hypothetical protein
MLPPKSWSATAYHHQLSSKERIIISSQAQTSSLLDPWSPLINGLFEYCFWARFHFELEDDDDHPSWPSLAIDCLLWGALWLLPPTASWPGLSVEEGESCAVCFLDCSISPWNVFCSFLTWKWVPSRSYWKQNGRNLTFLPCQMQSHSQWSVTLPLMSFQVWRKGPPSLVQVYNRNDAKQWEHNRPKSYPPSLSVFRSLLLHDSQHSCWPLTCPRRSETSCFKFIISDSAVATSSRSALVFN